MSIEIDLRRGPKTKEIRRKIKKESDLTRNSSLYGDSHEAVIISKKEISALKERLNSQTQQMIQQGLVVADPIEYRQDLIQQLLVIESEISGETSKSKEYKKVVERYNEQLNILPSMQPIP